MSNKKIKIEVMEVMPHVSHRDVYAILTPLKAAGFEIHDGDNMTIYILDNYVNHTGKIMFKATPIGRADDTIYYKVEYNKAFDSLMQPIVEH